MLEESFHEAEIFRTHASPVPLRHRARKNLLCGPDEFRWMTVEHQVAGPTADPADHVPHHWKTESPQRREVDRKQTGGRRNLEQTNSAPHGQIMQGGAIRLLRRPEILEIVHTPESHVEAAGRDG